LLSVVHVVDDDALFRTAIRRRLEKAGYHVEVYSSAEHFSDLQPDETRAGCILLDVRLPGLSGLEFQTRLNELGSALPIVFLTAYPDIASTVRAIKTGAEDFLIKPIRSEELLMAVERALTRQTESRVAKVNGEPLRGRLGRLTPRERQVFELVARGKLNKQIARQLGITDRTVKAHRGRMMEKVGVQSVAELVSIAMRLGILE